MTRMTAARPHVEIACSGGVGRTGTAIAVLAIMSGIPPEDAVEWVRRNYHRRAVETPWQRQWGREPSPGRVVDLGEDAPGQIRPHINCRPVEDQTPIVEYQTPIEAVDHLGIMGGDDHITPSRASSSRSRNASRPVASSPTKGSSTRSRKNGRTRATAAADFCLNPG